jgi:hypothetical protein
VGEDEATWLRRARADDGRAFAELLEPALDPAFRLAMTILNDRGAAEDAVQEAALKAWRNLGSFRPDAQLRPWFLAIVANECRTARRGKWWNVLRFAEVPRRSTAADARAELIDLDAPSTGCRSTICCHYRCTTTLTCRSRRSLASWVAQKALRGNAFTVRWSRSGLRWRWSRIHELRRA